MVWDPKNWIDDIVNYRTPSCIVLGLNIYDDQTCNDLYKAFNGIYFATFIVFGMIMIFQGVKAFATAIKLICFKLTKKSAEKRFFDTKMCNLFLNDLNIISDRYHRIWNSEMKNEVMRKFSEHRRKCKICKDSYCVRSTLEKFFTQCNKNDVADKSKQSDMKLVFLNNRYTNSNGEIKQKKEKVNTKVNCWFSRELGKSRKKYSKSKSRYNIYRNPEIPHKNDTSGDSNCETEEFKEPEKKTDVSLDKDDLKKEISLNIDEIQLTLNKYGNYGDREKLKNKKFNKHNEIKTLRKIYYKNVINLKPNIKYPVFLLKDRSQSRITLKYKHCKFYPKSEYLSKTNIHDGKNFMRYGRNTKRIPLYKKAITDKSNENKNIIKGNNLNKNSIEKIRMDDGKTTMISELKSRINDSSDISIDKSKKNFHQLPSRIPTFLYPNESQSSIRSQTNDTQKNLRRFSVQDRINNMQELNKEIPVKSEIPFHNHLNHSDCINPSRGIRKTSSCTSARSKTSITSLNPSDSTDENELSTKIYNNQSDDTDNSIKDEILTNIVNLPKTTNFFRQKYRLYKNNKLKHLGSCESNRLDVILEHAPWDV